jgi:hypothetical protein
MGSREKRTQTRTSQTLPRVVALAENRSAGLLTGCTEGLPALGDLPRLEFPLAATPVRN